MDICRLLRSYTNGSYQRSRWNNYGSTCTKTSRRIYGVPPGEGFDHNFCITKNWQSGSSFVARALHMKSGRVLEVYSDQPGLQFYTGGRLLQQYSPSTFETYDHFLHQEKEKKEHIIKRIVLLVFNLRIIQMLLIMHIFHVLFCIQVKCIVMISRISSEYNWLIICKDMDIYDT
ncbi:uncharacterized protein LOC122525070 [Polistes fuscatus]|uniref:uncharacterized protein LOC122525070 n=1 Tax=Polistes fuscatus TaxID=30207 RepID=UPI001CA984A8|nr:uncharacterized protein LOC122525070 [Polistes fuscatus]